MLRRRRRGSLEKPPRVPWVLGPGKKYAVFLSHYKDEAGMEARYLRDLLQKVLRKPCFLDSQNLSSLSNLFTHGLLCSDSLVLLTTPFLRHIRLHIAIDVLLFAAFCQVLVPLLVVVVFF